MDIFSHKASWGHAVLGHSINTTRFGMPSFTDFRNFWASDRPHALSFDVS